MLVTVCVVKAGLGRYAWIPVVPLVWDVAVTFTADFEKIFDPQLGYFATASSLRASIDSGQLEGEALANAYASLSNAYLDGVLSVFFPTQTVTSMKQPAESNWFEMPKIGTIALMPPLASETQILSGRGELHGVLVPLRNHVRSALHPVASICAGDMFIEKYTPWLMVMAAMSAMMAVNDSTSIEP